MSRVGAVIAAAGMSRRMQGTDKLAAPLLGRPVLEHTLHRVHDWPVVEQVVLVVRRELVGEWRVRCKELGWNKTTVVAGGAQRQDSVQAGLEALAPCDWVVVHDGARPCVTEEIVTRGLEAVKETGAAAAAVPAKDTVKLVGAGMLVHATPAREQVWLVQTPQVFAYDIILQAYKGLDRDVTDDASAVEATGRRVKIFLGAYTNIKVTTPEDLILADAVLRSQPTIGGREGSGR